jgi:hypothetical protein
MFERSGAADPDVSAQGYQYAIVWNGTKHLVDGTSASAPTFTAIVALLNDALLAAGRPVLGFMNLLIWEAGASGQGFTDITSGNNKGCNGPGFPATDGWDPASGWGTPVSFWYRKRMFHLSNRRPSGSLPSRMLLSIQDIEVSALGICNSFGQGRGCLTLLKSKLLLVVMWSTVSLCARH